MRFLKLIFALLFLIPNVVLAETPEQVGFLIGGLTDSSGDPLIGGKVYTYACGTTTDKTTWQDGAKASSHTNPIILDGEGKKLVFADGCYKFRIDNASDVTQYTLDNLRFGLYNGAATYAGATTGAANAYVATLSPSLLALVNGARITFEANHTNTGASTLNVNSLGAIDLNRSDDTALTSGEIISGNTYTAVYESSTNAWLLQSPQTAVLVASTYTPTLTGVANVAASTAFACQYLRVNSVVNVSCRIDVDPTAAAPTVTQLGVSLPFASSFSGANTEQLAGTCATNSGTTNQSAAMIADATNDRAEINWQTATTANHSLHCIFTYRVI